MPRRRKRQRHNVLGVGEAVFGSLVAKAVMAGVASVGIMVFERVEGTRLGYQVAEIRKEIQSLRGSYIALKLRTEERFAPLSLQAAAEKRLGLLPADPEQVVLLDAF